MDGFFVLLGLMAIIGLFLGPIGFFLTLGARERLREAAGQISRLEARVKRLEAGGPRTGPLPEAIETPEGEAETIEEPAPEPAPEPEVAPVSPPARTAAALPGAPPARETAADIPDMTFGGPPVGARTPAPEPAPSRSLEELLGTRWTVWVGGVALCIGALMLVRYSIELGFFGPGVRILMALALSAALVGAGEWMRRSDREGAAGSAYIPGVLTAAGAVSAFGAIYAAWALYGFIGPATAFVALGATGVACMFAAALHGPALAGLGLIGSLVTPLVVQTNEPNPWALTIYLAVVSAAAYGLARLRLWLWLAAATAVGEGIWAFGYIGSFGRGDIVNFFQAGAAHVLVAAALAGWFICVGPWRNADAEKTPLDPVAVLVPAGFAFIAHVLLFAGAHHGQFGTGWIFVATLMTLLLAGIGLTSAPAVAVAAIAGLFVVATLRIWPGSFATDMAWRLPDWRLDTWVEPVNVGAYAGFALVGAFGVAALCAWRLLTPARASFFAVCVFAGTATVTPLVALLVSWLRFGMASANYTFAALAAALGAVFVTAAQVFRNRLGEAPAGERPAAVELGLGAFASATIAALALALVFALDGGTLTIALALSALGAAWVSTQLRIPALRWCVAALGVVVAARLAWEPRIVGAALGKTIVFNWLLAGYGVPAAAFGYAARLMRRASGVEDAPVQIGQALAILLSGFLVMFEPRAARRRHFRAGVGPRRTGLAGLLRLRLRRHPDADRGGAKLAGVPRRLLPALRRHDRRRRAGAGPRGQPAVPRQYPRRGRPGLQHAGSGLPAAGGRGSGAVLVRRRRSPGLVSRGRARRHHRAAVWLPDAGNTIPVPGAVALPDATHEPAGMVRLFGGVAAAGPRVAGLGPLARLEGVAAWLGLLRVPDGCEGLPVRPRRPRRPVAGAVLHRARFRPAGDWPRLPEARVRETEGRA